MLNGSTNPWWKLGCFKPVYFFSCQWKLDRPHPRTVQPPWSSNVHVAMIWIKHFEVGSLKMRRKMRPEVIRPCDWLVTSVSGVTRPRLWRDSRCPEVGADSWLHRTPSWTRSSRRQRASRPSRRQDSSWPTPRLDHFLTPVQWTVYLQYCIISWLMYDSNGHIVL